MNQPTRANTGLIYAICLVATLGGFLFGYDTAVISGAVASLENYFVLPYGWSPTLSHTMLGVIVSGALLGCVIGSSMGGWLAQAVGRRRGLIVAAIFFLLSGLGSAMPEMLFGRIGAANGHLFLPQFIVYRIFGGIGVGLASVLSPLYIAEMAPASIRGRLVSWNQMAIVLGILCSYFVNYLIVRQGDAAWNGLYGWRWMFACSAVPALLLLVSLMFVPESPRWLISKGRDGKALSILDRLYPASAPQMLEEMRPEPVTAATRAVRFGLKVWVAGILLSAFQQLVGIQVVMYYTPEIFKNMGYGTDTAMLQTILTGGVNVIFTLVAIYTVDRFGRKPLLLLGSALMTLFMVTLSLCFYSHYFGALSLVCVLGFVGSFAFSWGPITWVLLSEMFPAQIKTKAISIAVAVQWITNYLVSSTFPLLDKNEWLVQTFNHGASFFIFGMMALCSLFFVRGMIPETKGKTLEEMENIWKK